MPGLFIFIATHRLEQSRPPAGSGCPSAGLTGWEIRAVTAVASNSGGPRASPSALVGRARPLRARSVHSPTPNPR
jgi:hypothetical protein